MIEVNYNIMKYDYYFNTIKFIIMKKLTILLFITFIIISCENKETKAFRFTQHVNDKENAIQDTFLIQYKAYYVDKKGVNLDLILKSKANDTIPTQDIPKIEKVVNSLFEKNPKGKDIINMGTLINLRLYNSAGVKIREVPLKEYSSKDLNILKTNIM